VARVVQTSLALTPGGQPFGVVLAPETHQRRCKGCGDPIGKNQVWCSPSCQRADDPPYRDDDDYDQDEYREDW
jgi:hypothetical protein